LNNSLKFYNKYYLWLLAVLYGLKIIFQLKSNYTKSIIIDVECDSQDKSFQILFMLY